MPDGTEGIIRDKNCIHKHIMNGFAKIVKKKYLLAFLELCVYTILYNEQIFIHKNGGTSMPKSPERCQEIREEMRAKILHDAMLYFAKNGFAGTKISDLAKRIGIGQGTLYLYFKSKEDLFHEIYAMIDSGREVQKLKLLAGLPLPAKQKIHKLSKFLMDRLEKDEGFAAMIALNAQATLEQNGFACEGSSYEKDWYQYTAKIIEQGQKEKSVVTGSPMKLADYYWGVMYLYSLKKLFTTKYETISVHDLERILLKDSEK